MINLSRTHSLIEQGCPVKIEDKEKLIPNPFSLKAVVSG
jgi:hypothetical protein